MKVPNNFIVPEYLRGINWERLGEELKLPSRQFWALQWMRQKRAEKQAYQDFLHKYYIAKGYKHKEKNGVHCYWKKVKKK